MRNIIVILFGFIFLAGCSKQPSANEIKVGTIAGPETQLMEVAAKVAEKEYGLNVKIVQFSDYTMPNAALADGSIDANMFQHIPYLQQAIKQQGYSLSVVGKTFLYPMGIYSQKITTLADLAQRAEVAIPNDPSNEARALLLLEKAHLITLKPNSGVNATVVDISQNPHQLNFKEIDAAQLPRVLPDVALAVINTNYAIPAGLHPTSALLTEDSTSPYVNIVVVRTQDRHNKKYQELVSALHSAAVLAKAKELFGDGAIPGWK
ncbi:MAG: MetQ/NlpA family ABC transporter substrate-binding protein [Legionellales bacterium]|nr:MetQ/NlpA family ABC transporter substrate-binding protein [Legionellales bacterium]